MKACKFCGTQVQNGEKHCPSCGSAVFLHICENCGTQFDSGFCPNCGVKAGQEKKVCPECGTVYFSNACPNCGYMPSRKPAVQEVVHKHVYVSPEPQPRPAPARQVKKKGKGCGCLTWILVLFVIGALFGSRSISGKQSSGSTRSTSAAKVTARVTKDPSVTEAPTATPEPAVAAAQEKVDDYFKQAGKEETAAVRKADSAFHQLEAVKSGKVILVERSWAGDRGAVGSGRSEPNYIGSLGYAAVCEDQRLEKDADFGTTPWKVPVYRKDKQFWEEAGSVDHKTGVVVVGQELKMPERVYSTSRCSGYLHVIRMDTGEDCWLNVENYVTAAYWEESLLPAQEKGYCIAAFRQVSDYYPVTKGKEKVVLEEGTPVLLPMKSKVYTTSPDKTNNPVAGIVFREWKYGFGGVTVFFSAEDLTLVY